VRAGLDVKASVSVAGLFGSAKVGVDATLTGPGAAH